MKNFPLFYFMNKCHKVLTTDHWQIARRDYLAYKTLQKIEALKEQNVWEQRVLKKIETPIDQHSKLLAEMRSMSLDFELERKWKMAAAKQIAEEISLIVQGKKLKSRAILTHNLRSSRELTPEKRAMEQSEQIITKRPQSEIPSSLMWSKSQDSLLFSCFEEFGPGNWELISQTILTKSVSDCKERWEQLKEFEKSQGLEAAVSSLEASFSIFKIMKSELSALHPIKRPLKKISFLSHPSHEVAIKKAGIIVKPTPSELASKRLQKSRLVHDAANGGPRQPAPIKQISSGPLGKSPSSIKNFSKGQISVNSAPTIPKNLSKDQAAALLNQRPQLSTALKNFGAPPQQHARIMQAIQQLATTQKLSAQQLSQLTAVGFTSANTQKGSDADEDA